jgi:hypothetical protein
MGSAPNTRILAHAEHRCTALLWRVACHGFLQMRAGSRQRAKPQPRHPKSIVGDNSEGGVVGVLRQAQQCFPDLACRMQL